MDELNSIYCLKSASGKTKAERVQAGGGSIHILRVFSNGAYAQIAINCTYVVCTVQGHPAQYTNASPRQHLQDGYC